ncbi:MAG TPA: hypothetical protein VF707_15230 [Ardenticatenaceae bacterium]
MDTQQPLNGQAEEWPNLEEELPWIAENEARIQEETKDLAFGEIGRYFQGRAAARQAEQATEST